MADDTAEKVRIIHELREIRRRLGPYCSLQPERTATLADLGEVARRLGELVDLLLKRVNVS